jgi:hypothetical protein
MTMFSLPLGHPMRFIASWQIAVSNQTRFGKIRNNSYFVEQELTADIKVVGWTGGPRFQHPRNIRAHTIVKQGSADTPTSVLVSGGIALTSTYVLINLTIAPRSGTAFDFTRSTIDGIEEGGTNIVKVFTNEVVRVYKVKRNYSEFMWLNKQHRIPITVIKMEPICR